MTDKHLAVQGRGAPVFVTACGLSVHEDDYSEEEYGLFVWYGRYITTRYTGFCKACVERLPLLELAATDLEGTEVPKGSDQERWIIE